MGILTSRLGGHESVDSDHMRALYPLRQFKLRTAARPFPSDCIFPAELNPFFPASRTGMS